VNSDEGGTVGDLLVSFLKPKIIAAGNQYIDFTPEAAFQFLGVEVDKSKDLAAYTRCMDEIQKELYENTLAALFDCEFLSLG
jgi:hypothetical protein